MKAGFWIAPEGAEADMTIVPIGADGDGVPRLRPIGLLATQDAAHWISRCPRTAALLPELADALAAQTAAAPGRLFDIFDFAAEERDLVQQVLGEGEVSGVAALPDGVIAQIQEAVMAGLWRVRFTDAAGALVADYIEVGAVPQVVREAVSFTKPDFAIGVPPAQTMNVLPVLAEIRERMAKHRPGDPAHVIAFSLFPMTEADMQFLQQTLGEGPAQLLSRGYGTCRILATGARNVWSVQFTNVMGTVILDTLEIGDVPLAACAADEDFHDSAERLREIDEAYFK